MRSCPLLLLPPHQFLHLHQRRIERLRESLLPVVKLQQRVQRLSSRLYSVGDPPSGFLSGLKAALACLGIGNGRLAPPAASLLPHQRGVIEQHLQDLGLFNAAPVKSH